MTVNLLAPQEFGRIVTKRIIDRMPSENLRAVFFQYPMKEDSMATKQGCCVTFSISCKWNGLDGDGIDFIVSCEPLEDVILEQISSAEINIIVGVFSAGVCRLSYLCELSKRQDVPSIVVGCLPAMFEGKLRRERAMSNVRKCAADQIITIDGAAYERELRHLNPSITLDEWKDKMITVADSTIRELLDTTNAGNTLKIAEMIAKRECV